MTDSNNTIEMIEKMCKNHNVVEYSINPDMSIDIYQNLQIPYNRNLTSLPNFNINTVHENASVRKNMLTNLINSPNSVCGNFWADYNMLTSIEGMPKFIGGNLHIEYNQLLINEENFKILMFTYVGGNIFADQGFLNAYNRYVTITDIITN